MSMDNEERRFRRFPFSCFLCGCNVMIVGRCYLPVTFRECPNLPRIPKRPVNVQSEKMRSFTSGGTSELRNVLSGSGNSCLAQDEGAELGATRPLVILVHQWSKMGGNSSLMDGIAKELSGDYGIAAVTFNLRGVGDSSGRSTFKGIEEVKDVVAVCEWAVATLNAQSIFLLGSSAGAPIAGSALDAMHEVRGYIAVGYVFGFLASWVFGSHYKAILESTKPKLMIHGDKDAFTSLKKFNEYFDQMKESKRKIIIPYIGHFELEAPHFDNIIVKHTVNFIMSYSAVHPSDQENTTPINLPITLS